MADINFVLDSKLRRALSLGLRPSHISVLRQTDKWRGKERRARAFLFGTFQHGYLCKVQLSSEN